MTDVEASHVVRAIRSPMQGAQARMSVLVRRGSRILLLPVSRGARSSMSCFPSPVRGMDAQSAELADSGVKGLGALPLSSASVWCRF